MCGGVEVAKRRITKLDVLALLKEGRSIKQIAEKTGTKENAVYTHRRRLIQQGLWQKSETILPTNVNPDELINAFLQRVEKADESIKELESLRQENYTLRNQLEATKNELIVAQEELSGRPAMAERIKKLAANLHSQEIKLSEEAQK